MLGPLPNVASDEAHQQILEQFNQRVHDGKPLCIILDPDVNSSYGGQLSKLAAQTPSQIAYI